VDIWGIKKQQLDVGYFNMFEAVKCENFNEENQLNKNRF